MVWEIIASVATALSVIVAVITYVTDHHFKKRAATIHAIDRVLDAYYEYVRDKDPNKDYKEYTKFMSIVERIAADANERVILKKLIKARLSILLINEYDKHMKNIIDQRRNQFSRNSYYQQIEKLIQYLK